MPELNVHLRPLRTYRVEIKAGEVWVDVE
jgi:hypothetical protein